MPGIGRYLTALLIAVLVVCLLPIPQGQAASYSRDLSEALALSDSVQARKYSPRLETISLNDALVAKKFTSRLETISLDDALAANKFTPRTESISISDFLSVTVYRFNTRDVSESLSFSELVRVLVYRFSDSLTLSETISSQKFTPRSEDLLFSDVLSVTVYRFNPMDISDSLTLSETISSQKFTPRSEDLFFSDVLSIAVYRFNTRDVSESLSFSELVRVLVYRFSDSLTLSETISSEKFIPNSEDLFFSDVLSVTVYRFNPMDILAELSLGDVLVANKFTPRDDSLSLTDATVTQKFTPMYDSLSISEVVMMGVYRMGEGGTAGVPTQHLPLPSLTTPEGIFTETVMLKSLDDALLMMVIRGTTAKSGVGAPLLVISILKVSEPPSPPERAYIIGVVYDLGPSGASFDSPVILTFTYDPARLPEGISERNLVIAYWDDDRGKWILLDSIINTANHTVTAAITHFTMFTILGFEPGPPAFEIRNLTVLPESVEAGERVMVSVSVANTGGTEGTYNVVILVNDMKEAEESVTVAAGRTERVMFSIVKEDPGSYSVVVDGLSSSFNVIARVAPPQPPEVSVTLTEPLPLVMVTVTPLAPPSAPAEEPSPLPPAQNQGVIWTLLSGTIIAAGLLAIYFLKRRAGKR